MIDVFRVGVHIGMTTNGPQTIAVLLRELGLLHGSIDGITAKMGKFKLAIGGAVAAFAGTKALEGLWHMVRASSELNKELNRTSQLGGEFAASIGAARAAAFQTSYAVPTASPAENVRVQRELGTQLQNPQAAIDILPIAQKVAYVVSNYTGEKVEDIIKNLVKVADLRAQIFTKGPDGKERVDASKVMAEFEAAAHGLILAGNYLKSNDLVQMARQGGVPVKGMTQEAFYANMVEMAVSQGASRAGTAVTSLFSQMIGGTMPVHVAKEMERIGMMSAKEWSSDHGHVIMAPSVSERLKGVQQDPIAFITGPLNDLMSAKGMGDQEKLMEVFRLFGRQTVQRLVAEALSNEPQFERARNIFHDIPSTAKQFQSLQDKDLDTNILSFEKAWKGLMQALGEQGIPLAISVLHGLTNALHAMTAWAVAHPDAARHLEQFAAALALTAAVGGSLIVVTFLLSPFAAGLRLLVGALAGAGAAAAGAASLAAGVRTLIGLLAGGVPTIGAAATGASAVGIGAVAAGAGILGGLYIAHENMKPLTEEQQRRLLPMSLPNDGYGVDGRPITPSGSSPYVSPPGAGNQNMNVQLRGDVHVDGRRLGEISASGIAKSGAAPSGGTTGFDVRAGTAGGLMGIP